MSATQQGFDQRTEADFAAAVAQFDALFEGDPKPIRQWEMLCRVTPGRDKSSYTDLRFLREAIALYRERKDGLESETHRLFDPQSKFIQNERGALADVKAFIASEDYESVLAERKRGFQTGSYPDMFPERAAREAVCCESIAQRSQAQEVVVRIESALNALQTHVPTGAIQEKEATVTVEGYVSGFTVRRYPNHRQVWEMRLQDVSSIMTGGNNTLKDLFDKLEKSGQEFAADMCIVDEDGRSWRFNAAKSGQNLDSTVFKRTIEDTLVCQFETCGSNGYDARNTEGFKEWLRSQLPQLVRDHPPLVEVNQAAANVRRA